jgi:hypothetical protein
MRQCISGRGNRSIARLGSLRATPLSVITAVAFALMHSSTRPTNEHLRVAQPPFAADHHRAHDRVAEAEPDRSGRPVDRYPQIMQELGISPEQYSLLARAFFLSIRLPGWSWGCG